MMRAHTLQDIRSISIVIAALNEETVLKQYFNEVLEVLKETFVDYEIILINDASTDKTGSIIDSLAAEHERVIPIHHSENKGLGSCYQSGVLIASKVFVMLLCGDGGVPSRSLPLIFNKLNEAEIIIPWMENLQVVKTPARFMLSQLYTATLNYYFNLKLKYYNGLAVHKLINVKPLLPLTSGFGFQAEVLIKLIKSGKSFVEVPVLAAENKGTSSALRLRNWISVIKMFLEIRKLKK